MGKKKGKKKEKKRNKGIKKKQKKLPKAMTPHGCKTKCCDKYKKSEDKRCKRCPCFDLLNEYAA
ncbi:hypothetical protein [Sediminicola arcticus]|uniref:Uncharacterized protein n=1 Tax=Sediminicola arcticus TaxID=1574308 RepID=A0ABV2SVL7_9FLAO